MWNLKRTTVPVIIGATGIVTRSLKKNLETIPGKHLIESLQKTAILGTSHISIRKVLQCEAWSLSGGDHCWFKRSTRHKCLWQRDPYHIIIIIIIIIINFFIRNSYFSYDLLYSISVLTLYRLLMSYNLFYQHTCFKPTIFSKYFKKSQILYSVTKYTDFIKAFFIFRTPRAVTVYNKYNLIYAIRKYCLHVQVLTKPTNARQNFTQICDTKFHPK